MEVESTRMDDVPISIRETEASKKIVNRLMKEYPLDYPTRSLVYRAALFRLEQWKIYKR